MDVQSGAVLLFMIVMRRFIKAGCGMQMPSARNETKKWPFLPPRAAGRALTFC